MDISTAQAGPEPGLLVAQDVLGGQFIWVNNGEGPTIHYFAPDTLQWEDLGIGYSAWISWVLGGRRLSGFYESLRWPGWEAEAGSLRLDEGITTHPPPFFKEGKDLGAVNRARVPMQEAVGVLQDFAEQFDGPGAAVHLPGPE